MCNYCTQQTARIDCENHVIYFRIKKQNFFIVSMIAKGFVFLIHFVWSKSDVGGWVEKKRQNDVLHDGVNMDASNYFITSINQFD